MTDRPAADNVRTNALETAYRLDAHSFYGGTQSGAIRALERRCPGWQREELESLLGEALLVQRAVRPWLEEHEAELRSASDEGRLSVFASFRAAHPGWPADGVNALLGMNYLFFFLK